MPKALQCCALIVRFTACRFLASALLFLALAGTNHTTLALNALQVLLVEIHCKCSE